MKTDKKQVPNCDNIQVKCGHGDHGIVSEPCTLHLPEFILDRIMMDGRTVASMNKTDTQRFNKAYRKFFARRGLRCGLQD
jgi:hypothetical protein